MVTLIGTYRLTVVLPQSAVNVTSSLLKEMNKIQDSGLTTNILVSCNKLETFVLQYARYHMNNSQAEMSIEEDELGKVSLLHSFWPPK